MPPLLRVLAPLALLAAAAVGRGAAPAPANVIVILTDDQGYGDLGCYGSPSIRTPHLDRMAAEGVRFTDFYSGAEVCSPSRAALLTGRYPPRSGMAGHRRVLFPNSEGGLPAGEVTLAEALKARGYATAHIGKWHLGIRPGSRPRDQGFDRTFGLPYSNDMDAKPGITGRIRASDQPPVDGWNVPLERDGEVLERPAVQATLTRRYTDEARRFIAEHADRPFFLYLAHSMPHTPLFASPEFRGRSRRGLYGDVVEELDASTGEILDDLRRRGLAERTFVFYTSDNGPWLIEGLQGGSAGPLREGKGSTWEGGMRVPGIAWMPGRLKPAVTSVPASFLDLFPTALALAGAPTPTGVTLDGTSLLPLLVEGRDLGERAYFFYRGFELFACRLGDWKAHFQTQAGYGQPKPESHERPLLFRLPHDPGERHEIGAAHPEILARIQQAVAQHRAELVPGPPQFK